MKLDRLIVQGFKSFKDRTVISFDDRITGIVGPNGCGKSNIIDALFWVMGEQSAKHLRGDKMSDLIFSGTNKYSPATFAEVTLVLQNTQMKHIHIGGQILGPEVIELTRRLYRDGETEYRINNLPARLKDIQEVFMDTGAGAKSYAIIAQGEIDRLVRAKPQERRYMIDEVAGVTKFKVRRKESLKKLELTQSNLERLKDLEDEVYKQLKHLEEQAKKAKKAKDLREKINHHEWLVLSHKELAHLEDIIKAQDKIEHFQLEATSLRAKIQGLSLGSSEQELKQTELLDALNVEQEKLQQTKVILATTSEKIKYTGEHLKNLNNREQQLNRDIQSLVQEKERLKERLAQNEKKRSEAQAQKEQVSSGEDLSAELESLQVKLKEKEIIEIALKKEVAEFEKMARSNDQKAFELTSQLRYLGEQLQDLAKEIESLEGLQGPSVEEMQEKRDELVALQIFTEEERKKISTETQSLQAEQQLQRKLNDELSASERSYITLKSKKESLEQVQYKTIVKKGISLYANQGAEAAKEIQLLSKFIHCTDPELLKVVQFGLKKELDSWPLSFDELKNKTEFFVEKKWGADFISTYPEAQAKDQSAITLPEGFTALSEVIVSKEESFSEALKAVTQGIFVTDLKLRPLLECLKGLSLEERSQLRRIISKDLKYIVECFSHQIFVDCFQNEEQQRIGQLELAKDLEELASKVTVEHQRVSDLKVELEEKKRKNQELSQQLEERKNVLNYKSERLVGLRAQLQGQEKALEIGKNRLEQLFQKKNQTSKDRLNLMETEDEVRKKIEEFQLTFSEKQKEYQKNSEELTTAKKSYDQLYSKIVERKAFIKNFEQQERMLLEAIEDLKNNEQRLDKKEVELNTQLEECISQKATLAQDLGTLEEKNIETLKTFKELEVVVKELQDELHELDFELGGYLTEKKSLESKLSKVDKDLMEIELKAQRYRQDEADLEKTTIDEKNFSVRAKILKFLDLTEEKIDSMKLTEVTSLGQQLLTLDLEVERLIPSLLKESSEKLRRYKSDLNSLGEINWGADQDFERYQIRYQFLKTQGDELKKSKEDLLQAIDLIDKKSAERFKIAFEEVNNKFSKVFPIIFGGGVASLELVGAVDDPECGLEIIARPPGKKMTNINLMSGGEKALTAVSLIFSIFLVKPAPFCLLDEVDAPLDDANVGRFNELLKEMSADSQFVLITHNKKTMELNNALYGITMQEPGVSKALSVQLQ